MSFRPFSVADLHLIEVQPRHAEALAAVLADLEPYRMLEGPTAWTLWRGGRPLGCAGITQGVAWAFLGRDLRRDMVRVTRFVRRILELHRENVGPVTAEIDESFPAGVQWALLLGFRRSSPGVWTYE